MHTRPFVLLNPCTAARCSSIFTRNPPWRASQSHSTFQQVIRQAVAVARLVGVPTPVHVRQIECPNGAQHAAGREEFADRGGAPHIDAENVLAAREEITDV